LPALLALPPGAPMQSRLPFTIVTGFLGAGKSTLLNRLLVGNVVRRLALIINEFGAIDIDSRLVVDGAAPDVVQLTNGCVCCTVRGDLVAGLAGLLARRDAGEIAFDHIVMETTGLADPGPVARALASQPALRARISLDRIVTVADARHCDAQLDRFEEAQRQVGLADLILLNKIDLVSAPEREGTMRRLRTMNAAAMIEPTVQAAIDPRRIFEGAIPADRASSSRDHGDDDHAGHRHDRVTSVALTIERPLDLDKLQSFMSFLIMRYAERLLRYKGILDVRDRGERFVMQGLHDLVELRADRSWRAGDVRRSDIVFIGIDLPEVEIRNGLAAAAS
jgi:G3E family GTPase